LLIAITLKVVTPNTDLPIFIENDRKHGGCVSVDVDANVVIVVAAKIDSADRFLKNSDQMREK